MWRSGEKDFQYEQASPDHDAAVSQVEYGPLIRGTLFLAFHNSVKSKPGTLRILLRPQIRYCQKNEICYIVPTKELGQDSQIAIDISPIAGKELGV